MPSKRGRRNISSSKKKNMDNTSGSTPKVDTATFVSPPFTGSNPATPAPPQKAKADSKADSHTDSSPLQIPPTLSTPATQQAGQTAAESSSSQNENQSTTVVTETTAEGSEETKLFFLKFSLVAKPFHLPSHTEVALVGQQHFQQEGIKCIPIRTRSETCYKFELREPVSCEGHVLQFTNIQVPLSPWVQRQKTPRREGTLLTFRRAGVGPLESIPAEAFDKCMEDLHLNTIVSTRFQRIKDTRVLNGNRYCVVETPENLKSIPESIPVTNSLTQESFQVQLTFRGQERFCYTCNEMHIGTCPKLKERRRKEEQREQFKKSCKVKIYSDSTLRSADVLGLKCEIMCMSGGGLGQIIQSAIDDPEKKDTIVILGGTNDMKTENFPDSEDYAHNIDLSLGKLANFAKRDGNKNFYLVHQAPIREGSTQPTEEFIRDAYLAKRMNQLAEALPNIEALEIQYEVDLTGHPSVEGTREILRSLNSLEISGSKIIWDDTVISTDRPYSSVQSIYRYGCNGCDKFGLDVTNNNHNNQLLCDHCHDTFPDGENVLLRDITVIAQKKASDTREEDYPMPKRTKGNEDGNEMEDAMA